jgi:pimeloyl-ACP methyl ester carboxylesterase
MKLVRTPSLDIGYLEDGPADGPPVVLLHGFPDDAHAWEAVTPGLVADGCRVLAPWLRGYGPTRFLDPATPRSGEQAALGADLLAFLDALGIGRAALAGYDWSGCAASSRSTATISSTSLRPINRDRRCRSCATGINGISTRRAAAPG